MRFRGRTLHAYVLKVHSLGDGWVYGTLPTGKIMFSCFHLGVPRWKMFSVLVTFLLLKCPVPTVETPLLLRCVGGPLLSPKLCYII